MPIHFEQPVGERIVILRLSPDFSQAAEIKSLNEESERLFEHLNEPVMMLVDLRGVSFSLDDVIIGANNRSQQSIGFRHPKMLELILITDSRLIELAARGMNSPIFGNIKIKVLKTLDEALIYARQTLAMQKAG